MKRHRLDSTSLVAGVLFVLVAATYLLAQHWDRSIDARWVLPLVLVGLGVAGLAGAVQSLTTGSRERAATAAPAHPSPEYDEAGDEHPGDVVTAATDAPATTGDGVEGPSAPEPR